MPGIPQGVIDTILHPPLGLLTNIADGNSPYAAGDHTLTTWLNGATSENVNNTYGVLLLVDGVIPSHLGWAVGWESPTGVFDGLVYQKRFCQLVVQHQLTLGLGGWVTTQLEESYTIGLVVLWQEALPGRLGLHVEPGISMALQFLKAV